MADWKQQLQDIQTQRLQNAKTGDALYALQLQLQKAVAAAKQSNGAAGDQQDGSIKQLQAAITNANGRLVKGKASLQQQIGNVFTDPHPRIAVANMDDSIPFLLLPVRIETCFINTGRTNELWLRVYPDEIAIHSHEKVLTGDEVNAGETYWVVIFSAEKENAANKEDKKKTAWSDIVKLFGPQRAAWVVLQTKPANWSNDLSGIAADKDLVFPPQDLTKTNAWSRAPRTNVMPDKFVVQLYTGETVSIEVPGSLVPDELFMGPDPMDAKNAFQTIDDKLVFGDDYNWTADFDKAVTQGMGFRIPISNQQAVNGFDKILVVGVFASADEMAAKTMLEDLLDNHHYATGGLSVVTQGTPTNNTDQNGSGYTSNDPFAGVSYVTETGEPLFDENKDCDGRNLADALGIEYTHLQYILHSDATDYKEAVEMNTALYPATLGYYFDTLLHPVINDTTQALIRSFFTGQVTGRGALPAIRVGDQPYGVLLTSDFSKWTIPQSRLLENNDFFPALLGILKYYQGLWNGQLSKLNYVGKTGTDSSAVLMDILGLQAGSVAFFQRNAYSTDTLMNEANFQKGKKYFDDLKASFTSKDDLLNFFISMGLDTKTVKPAFTVPQLLRLVYQHYTSTLDAANLVDKLPLSEEKFISEYAAGAGKNYIDWLAAATTPGILEKQDFGAGVVPPSALLYLLLRKSLLEQLHHASAKWLITRKIPVEDSLLVKNFNNIRPGGEPTKWEVMKAPVKIAAPELAANNKSVAAYLLTTGIDEAEAQYLKQVKTALSGLAGLPTARLERCFTEHLDCCTYRLDAWQNALFRMRMLQQRQIQEDAGRQQRKKGIYLGAYGWLENIRPAKKQTVPSDTVPEKLRPLNNAPLYSYEENGGFVHAPSLNHASAAAVLRSGYLSHADAASPDSMAVNLSSERVRRALFILEGIRNGQQLEALLGYQFERGLHDRASADNTLLKLNSYMYDFRAAYPLEQHQLQQQGTEATVSIPANNVVNGVTLAAETGNAPWKATGGVLGASVNEKSAITAEQQHLADTLDAVKDLLLSESVYQLVLGNFDRAGAVVTALKDAHVPPVIEVIDTPRSTNFTFTNRVTIQFPQLEAAAAASNPWAPIAMTQRANIEPGMNKWLSNFLGVPADIFCRVATMDTNGNESAAQIITVDQLALQPIDLLYITGNEFNTGANTAGKEAGTGASELEQRIAWYYRFHFSVGDEQLVQIQFLPGAAIAGKKKLGELLPLIRMVKSLVTGSRFLDAQDYDTPSKKTVTDPSNPKGYDVTDLQTRVTKIRTATDGYLTTLNTIGITTQVIDKEGNTNVYLNLGDSFDGLDKASLQFSDAVVSFTDAQTSHLQQALTSISYTGIPDAFPQIAFTLTAANKNILLEQGRAVARKLTTANAGAKLLFDAAVALTDPEKKTVQLVAAAQLLLGSCFTVIPFFSYNNESDILQSFQKENDLFDHATNQLGLLFPAEEWLQRSAHTRSKLAQWDGIRTLQEVINGNSMALHVTQIPFRPKDSWVAVEYPVTYPGLDEDGNVVDLPFTISHDTLSVVVHGDAAFVPGASQSGLLIDDWTEQIPGKEEITGIGFNYNRPNAMPPQALLLAVTPVITGHWNWDNLVGIVNDTFLRAKLRAVDSTLLDQVNSPEISVLLPAILSNFTQYDLDISLDMRLNVSEFAKEAPVLTAASFKQ